MLVRSPHDATLEVADSSSLLLLSYPGKNADKVPKGSIKMAYWLGDCPHGATCPNKASSLSTGKAAFTVFDVTALRTSISHIASDGEVLYVAPPLVPRRRAAGPTGTGQAL
jgi:hypothetical protein